MGTAVLAIAADANPGNLAVLHGLGRGAGTVLAVVAYALGATLLVVYVLRWVRHTQAALTASGRGRPRLGRRPHPAGRRRSIAPIRTSLLTSTTI